MLGSLPGPDEGLSWRRSLLHAAAVIVILCYFLFRGGGESDGIGGDRYPTVSPDGNRVAFISGVGDPSCPIQVLRIIPLTGKAPSQDVASGVSDEAPAWSPDGLRVAVALGNGCALGDGLAVVHPGRPPRQITTGDDSSPAWSPDGAEIAFNRGRRLLVVTADGSRIRELSRRGSAPAWSPDGKTIAFEVYDPTDSTTDIHLIGADRTHERLLVRNGSEPSWSPDGSQIAYVDGRMRLRLVGPAKPTSIVTLVDNGHFMHDDDFNFAVDLDGGGAQPRWSPDGRTIAFTPATEDPADHWGFSADRALYRIERDGTRLTKLADHAYDASWAPDGRIVFARNGVRLIDAEGRDEQRLSHE